MASYLKFEAITFYNLSVYHYKLHDKQNCIITGPPERVIQKESFTMEWYQFYSDWLRLAFTKPLVIAQAVAFVCVLIAAFLKSKYPSWEIATSNLMWQIPLGLLVLLVSAGLINAPYQIYKDKKLENARPSGFATPDALIGSRLEGIDFRIVDLAREGIIIKDRTIINCRLYGPAVLYPVSCSFRNNKFPKLSSQNLEEAITSLFIRMPKTPIIQGVIKVENVDFRSCRFKGISFMGSDQVKKKLLDSTSMPD